MRYLIVAVFGLVLFIGSDMFVFFLNATKPLLAVLGLQLLGAILTIYGFVKLPSRKLKN